MADSLHVDLSSLAEFRSSLRKLGKEWTPRMRAVHKAIADEAAAAAVSEADSMGGVQAKYSGAIRARASARNARVAVLSSGANPGAFPAFWGTDKRTGWNAGNDDSAPQHPHWVGNSWQVGESGGPYAINQAISSHKGEILAKYQAALDALSAEAFPK